MPDRLTRAVVDIATQLRRIADHIKTPTDDAADTPTTTPVEHLAAKLWSELEQARKDADLCSRAARSAMEQRQEMATERYALQEQRDQLDATVDRVRKLLDETRAALRRAEGDRDAAEERRDELAATLHDVLRHFTQKGHPGEPCLQSGWIAEKTVARWRAVLNPPATEEQPDLVDQYTDPDLISKTH